MEHFYLSVTERFNNKSEEENQVGPFCSAIELEALFSKKYSLKGKNITSAVVYSQKDGVVKRVGEINLAINSIAWDK